MRNLNGREWAKRTGRVWPDDDWYANHPQALVWPVIDEQAAQCGYCYNGMIIKGSELLARNCL